MTAQPNLAGLASDAWDRQMRDNARRERDQVTQLSAWRRARNGVWVNDGRRRPLGMALRLLAREINRS